MTAKKTTTKKSARKPGKPAKSPGAKRPAESPAKKTSALDAAAAVLGKAKAPMTAKQLIEAMATEGLWTSPGGKTPHATLFSALIREINTKGPESRFRKADRGQFSLA